MYLEHSDIYPRVVKTYVHIKILYKHVHSSFIWGSPKLKTIQLSINR